MNAPLDPWHGFEFPSWVDFQCQFKMMEPFKNLFRFDAKAGVRSQINAQAYHWR